MKHKIFYNCKDCGKPVSTGSRLGRCKSCARKALAKPEKKFYCLGCGKRVCMWSGVYGQGRCTSCARKGKLNPKFGKIPSHGKGFYYKQSYMRSSYGVAYAKYCIKNHTKYRYESKSFALGNTVYTPDFYLPETNEYIEIKGWWRDPAIAKFKTFKKQYPKVNIKVLMKPELKKMGVL